MCGGSAFQLPGGRAAEGPDTHGGEAEWGIDKRNGGLTRRPAELKRREDRLGEGQRDWTGLDEDEDAHVWEDNWDDDNVEDDFSNQLRAELEKHGYKMETSQ
ncbi:26S proteasome complex subunit SEM1 isoform X1 [Oncorhynchus tshawytscha]|uniref:26S proteasome complex subunit SEM1 n=1 Tax=Oncorhynchus tshawytscha TaxID=74940 RepID=A0AAZ3NRX5_ONCTS|nr:26S proteasome complex subunit SEM1 isoform X1 [Oncorhynchus tshawytscha]